VSTVALDMDDAEQVSIQALLDSTSIAGGYITARVSVKSPPDVLLVEGGPYEHAQIRVRFIEKGAEALSAVETDDVLRMALRGAQWRVTTPGGRAEKVLEFSTKPNITVGSGELARAVKLTHPDGSAGHVPACKY
jgi:hypothetical protein